MIAVSETQADPNKDNAVNLPELYCLLHAQRWLIAKITGAFVVLGLLVALFSTVEYTSEALLIPDTDNNQSTGGSLLSNYGGILGLGGLGSSYMANNDNISPRVYPRIVKSLTFQDRLLKKEIYFSTLDTSMSGYTYFKDVRGPSLLGAIAEYTIGLPRKLNTSDSTDQAPDWLSKQFDDIGVIKLTGDELKIIKEMRQRVTIELDSETGVLRVNAKMPDAVAAAQVNQEVVRLLKEFIKSFSTQKAKEDLAFTELQHQQAQKELVAIQNELATFKDQNVNLSTAKSQMKERRLEAEFSAASNVYDNISQQLMTSKMNVQERTPAFKPLQEVNVPVENSEPQRLLILILSFLAGLTVSFLYIAGRSIYQT